MTGAHVLYIPIIFLLGFLTGMLMKRGDEVERSDTPARYSVTGRLLAVSFIIFLVAFAGTHFMSLPRSAHAVHRALNGGEIFDKKPSFTSAEVYQRIDQFPQKGFTLYQQFTYTTDVLFPLSMLSFLIMLSLYVSQRSMIPKKLHVLMLSIPAIWFTFDMLENWMIFHLLDNYPAQNNLSAGVLGYITVIKFTLLLLAIATPAFIKSLKHTDFNSSRKGGCHKIVFLPCISHDTLERSDKD